MKNKKKVALIMVMIICLLFPIVAIYRRDTKIHPSIKISKEYDWQRKDTNYCRFYFYNKNEQYMEIIDNIDDIYFEAFQIFNHHTKPNLQENGLLTVLLLENELFKELTHNSPSSAGWNGVFIFINIDKYDEKSLGSTLRHEIIHAVTLESSDTKAQDIPGWFSEGVAQYYQAGFTKGNYDKKLLKNAFYNDQILSWALIVGESSQWRLEDRPLMYTQSAHIYHFLIQVYQEEIINEIFYTEGSFPVIIEDKLHMTVANLEKQWIEFLKENI